MKKYQQILLWWFTFSALWGGYRLFALPEFFSELVAKPAIWLGVTFCFILKGLIPSSVTRDLRAKFAQTRPVWKIFLLPAVSIVSYFFLINFRQIQLPEFSALFLLLTLVINFSTGIVEEVVYRGILYVWLLKKTNEVAAFIVVQLLFLLGHVPTLLLNSDSLSAGLSHAFFIVFIGMMHTLIFRLTKSIYASSLTHGIWNSLAAYLLL